MASIRLKSFEDEYDNLGLIYKDSKITNSMIAANNGELLAHDLIEHQNGVKAIGSISDEIQAMGGCWFVRGQFGDFGLSNSPPEVTIANTLNELGRLFVQGIPMRAEPINTHQHREDYAFEEIIHLTKKGLLAEIDTYGENTQLMRRNIAPFLEQTKHLLRIGYNKASRRFKDDAIVANRMYHLIAEAIEPHAKYVEYVGQEYILTYTATRATCKEYFSPDNYYY